MIAAALLLAAQALPPTVGDTIWLERALGQVGEALVRPQPWSLGELGRQLGPAEVRRTGLGVVVRYPVALWYPGEHRVTMPGPVLISRAGRSDTLAPSQHVVRVTSVLPCGRSREAPAPALRPTPPVLRVHSCALVVSPGHLFPAR